MRRDSPSRRSKPLVPGAPAARHWDKGASAKGKEASARRRELATRVLESRPMGKSPRRLSRSPAAVDNKVSPPGAERSKPINTARGTPGKPALRGYPVHFLLQHRAQTCGVVRTPAFRAPSFSRRCWNCEMGMRPARGRPKNAGDGACLYLFTL